MFISIFGRKPDSSTEKLPIKIFYASSKKTLIKVYDMHFVC